MCLQAQSAGDVESIPPGCTIHPGCWTLHSCRRAACAKNDVTICVGSSSSSKGSCGGGGSSKKGHRRRQGVTRAVHLVLPRKQGRHAVANMADSTSACMGWIARCRVRILQPLQAGAAASPVLGTCTPFCSAIPPIPSLCTFCLH